MNKRSFLLAATFVLVFVAGLAVMRIWDSYQAGRAAVRPHKVAAEPMVVVDLKGATAAEGITVVDTEPAVLDDSVLPSQLAKIELSGVKEIITKSGARVESDKEPAAGTAPVVLGNEQFPVVSRGAAVKAPEAESKISMIEAPVEVRLIKNLAQYKEFKRTARGKYPTANFAEDDVLVLESTSNLPDKVFEIQDVVEKDGKILVTYRVNVFGLDKKINTHSAVRIAKRDLPIELKQVL